MTTCDASLNQSSYVVGQTITANFTWANAVKKVLNYAYMYIKDPSNNIHVSYSEQLLPTSPVPVQLSTTCDQAGTWAAVIIAYGSPTDCTDTATANATSGTSCDASLNQSSYVVGQTITANFTWANAVKNVLTYAVMYIKDPSGNVHVSHYEQAFATSPVPLQLQTVCDQVGTWTAFIIAYGSPTDCTDTATANATEGGGSLTSWAGLWPGDWLTNVCNISTWPIQKDSFAHGQQVLVPSRLDIPGHSFQGQTYSYKWKDALGTVIAEYSWTITDNFWDYICWQTSITPPSGTIHVEWYLDGAYVGSSNYFVVISEEETTGFLIGPPDSYFNPGPVLPGTTNWHVSGLWYGNNGNAPGNIYIAFYWNYEGIWQFIEQFTRNMNPQTQIYEDFYIDISSTIKEGSTFFGVKVWGEDENEPDFPTLTWSSASK